MNTIKPTFTGARNLADYPRLDLDALSRTMPGMPGLTGPFRYEDGLDTRTWLEDYAFIVLTGDVSIMQQQRALLTISAAFALSR